MSNTVTSKRPRSPLSASARNAASRITSPPFMSVTPGPSARAGSLGSSAKAWNGESASNTVSK
ncbi:MAG TPA: hypothetical protein VMR86_19230 [Myxococcota bacterium]|nr:hypothetical protein [Myxococcota bacterium]